MGDEHHYWEAMVQYQYFVDFGAKGKKKPAEVRAEAKQRRDNVAKHLKKIGTGGDWQTPIRSKLAELDRVLATTPVAAAALPSENASAALPSGMGRLVTGLDLHIHSTDMASGKQLGPVYDIPHDVVLQVKGGKSTLQVKNSNGERETINLEDGGNARVRRGADYTLKNASDRLVDVFAIVPEKH